MEFKNGKKGNNIYEIWARQWDGSFFLLLLTDGADGLKGLNLARCGTRNMLELSDNILSQEGRPNFISIVRYKAWIFGSMMLR